MTPRELPERPNLEQLKKQAKSLLHAAEAGDRTALPALAKHPADPSVTDKDGVTPLHRAAMGGHPAAVRTLLQFGAPKGALDGMFAAPPIVWAVEGRNHAGPGSDHVAVARLLIAAGSPTEWTPPADSPSPERTLEGLSDLKRATSLHA